MQIRPLPLLLLLSLAALPLCADDVYLVNGRKFEGVIAETGGVKTIYVDASAGGINAAASNPRSIGPLTVQGPSIGIADFGFEDGMVVLTMIYMAADLVRNLSPGSAWVTVLTHISYLDVWINLLEGKLEPRLLLSFASLTVLFQYLTVKVLEARKWL